MDDQTIVELYWQRSEAAIEETSKKYDRYCSKISYNILYNFEDTKECVNDTYLRAWNSIPTQRPTLLSAYLGKIVRNVSLNKYRELKAKKRGGDEVKLLLSELEECIASNNTNIEDEIDGKELSKMISDFLRSINEESRLVFVRRYWYADAISDIATRFEMTEGKVKTILFRTRLKLKAYLEKEGVTI